MSIREFFWEESNIEHIAKHNVSPEEVEEVAFDDDPYIRTYSDIKYLYGKTVSGRYLFTVYRLKNKNLAWVITSRDMDEKERKLYKNKR